MAGRSPVRFLAPLALVAFLIALFMVVSASERQTDSEETPAPSGARPTATADGTADGGRRERKGPRRYRIKPGDTPSAIADKTGVSVEEILRLNPDLDPQALTVGQRIKLRQ